MLKRLLLAMLAAFVALALASMFGVPFGAPSVSLASDSGPPMALTVTTLAPDMGQEVRILNMTYADFATLERRGHGIEPATVLLV